MQEKTMSSSNAQQNNKLQCDTVIAGGGIAGLVTALELLKQGQQIIIIDRDTKERLGGLARWAFGGMALCDTKQQKRMKIPDNANLLLKDWHSFAEFSADDVWPKAWAKEYAEQNHDKVYQWLLTLGMTFLPAVNWVERGLYQSGNSVPRYHVLWGTGWGLVETIIKKLSPYLATKQLSIYHQHKVLTPLFENNKAVGLSIIDELNQGNGNTLPRTVFAKNVVIACGGINGSTKRVKQNWYKPWGKVPDEILNGANPISDGKLHDQVEQQGGKITHVDKMWNYAAGIPHPQAEFPGHGLSLIPCKSALWVDHLGKRIGPDPLVTGFDTNFLCKKVAQLEKPWSWQILNKRIALKELAISGSLHNPSIRDKKLLCFLKEILFGNKRLVQQLTDESADFICADSISQLCKKMNAITDENYIDSKQLMAEISQFDHLFSQAHSLQNDDQLRRINHARQWQPDRLRTCQPQAMLKNKKSQPEQLIAIKVQLISRKSLGGIQTNLASQVLNQQGSRIDGLYCVGEAAGFGGGGANGFRSLEGTFLSACILTARNAAEAIIAQPQITNNK